MVEQGLIEPSNSPLSSPVVIVKKKDGYLHFCVDYCQLHYMTRKDSYPLPRVDDALEALASMKWFSTFDLRSQVSVIIYIFIMVHCIVYMYLISIVFTIASQMWLLG